MMNTYPLFEYMMREHNVTLLENELSEVMDICAQIVQDEMHDRAGEYLTLVIENTNVSFADMVSKSRAAKLVQARSIYMYLAYKYTRLSISEIGRIVMRNHSTVIHNIKVVQGLVEVKEINTMNLLKKIINIHHQKK